MGDGEQGQRGKQRDPAVHLDLAVSVGPVPDQAGADEGGRAADQIDEGNVRLGDADIVHRIDGDVGNDREAGKDDQRREEQGAQVVGVGEDTEGCRQQVGPFFLAQVMAQFRQEAQADDDEQHAEQGDQHERRPPAEVIGQPQRQGNAGNRR